MTDHAPVPDHTDLPDLDEALVRRLVANQFPQWAHLPVTAVVPGGVDNRTFRLGRALSVRLPAGAGYAQQVAKEQRWLPLLAGQLPLPVPDPVGLGRPGEGYPFPWSVYGWIEGRSAAEAGISATAGGWDATTFATDLAGFLVALRRVDARGGPAPGEHNFFRGGPLTTYHDETVAAISALEGEIDADACRAIWRAATPPGNRGWTDDPVWFHGDVAVGNLLVDPAAPAPQVGQVGQGGQQRRLAAVIDFGTSGVGDPACDLVVAWTLFSGDSRAAFRGAVDLDAATWARARGWALWKALITLADARGDDSPGDRRWVEGARHTLHALVEEHQSSTGRPSRRGG